MAIIQYSEVANQIKIGILKFPRFHGESGGSSGDYLAPLQAIASSLVAPEMQHETLLMCYIRTGELALRALA